MKGMRVQSIIRELRGEKIDIIEFSEDPVDLATRALSPARISRVTILDPVGRHLEVVVDEMQLSLAIGKKGQNVRLAAKLMGWRIDIKSEEEKRNEVEAAMAAISGSGTPVSVLIDYGLAEFVVDKLLEGGSSTVEALADMTPEQLDAIPGMNPGVLEQIQIAVNGYYEQFEPQQEAIVGDGEEAVADDTDGADAAPKGPMVLPGLPEEGSVEDDDDDVEIPLDDFDTMKRRSAPQQPAGVVDEDDEDLSDDDLEGAEDRD